tara:strand:+ start:105 stop:386 length:282 start_codon:yes stop_codon:yes gene_type:complete
MNKDNFYYILKDRLEYAHDYVLDSSNIIRSVNFQKKVEREFYKDKKILLFFSQIINLPINVYKYYRYLRGIFNYKRAVKEIEVLKQELKKYDN